MNNVRYCPRNLQVGNASDGYTIDARCSANTEPSEYVGEASGMFMSLPSLECPSSCP
jgi:hypothetical protein